MSKPTETTNERVPRDIVRLGKHTVTIVKHTEAWGNTRKRTEAHGSTRKRTEASGESLGVKRYMFY